MAKRVDITEKLELGGNPSLLIKDEELEVNADAASVLKIMGIVGDGEGMTSDKILSLYDILFPEETRDKIAALKLSFADLQIVIDCAMELVTGESEQGEPVQKPTMI